MTGMPFFKLTKYRTWFEHYEIEPIFLFFTLEQKLSPSHAHIQYEKYKIL